MIGSQESLQDSTNQTTLPKTMTQTTVKKQTTKEPYNPDKGVQELADKLISLMEKGCNPFRKVVSS